MELRSSYFRPMEMSFPIFLNLLGRILLFASIVLSLRRAEDPAVRVRHQRAIALLMSAQVIVVAVAYFSFAFSRPALGNGPRWRTPWLVSISVTLSVLNPLLVSLCFRKQETRYNSEAASHPYSGAGA